MARCEDCNFEMTTADGCTVGELRMGNRRFRRTTVASTDPRGRCGDCGARRGAFHHLGCDMEPCPTCRRQLISCDCYRTWDADGEEQIRLEPVLPGAP